jgi:predicted methyltransferase
MHGTKKRTLRVLASLAAATVIFAAAPVRALDPVTDSALDAAIAGDHRTAEDKARDAFRKPKQVLDFLGFRSDMTVVEIWPGGGWYSKILAPALKERGGFYAAQYSVNPAFGYQRRYFGAFLTMLGTTPDLYRDVKVTHLALPYQLEIAPAGSADMVVTFRNVHNWVGRGYASGRYAGVAFTAMYDALKPGGVLGIVDHRWPDPDTEDPDHGNGYISKELTISLAEAAGFKLVGESDILSNPKDTHDHPRGVWTLPPTLALGDEDRDKYIAIGESDRFLLKFEKPAE